MLMKKDAADICIFFTQPYLFESEYTRHTSTASF